MCVASITAGTEHSHEGPTDLLSAILDRSNMLKAYDRVLKNKGAPGIDGVTTSELKDYLKCHWLQHKALLVARTYQPQPVRKVEIPQAERRLMWLGLGSASF